MIEFYTPREISFTREHNIWLIAHIDILESGLWPPDPEETGYIESKIMVSPSNHAPYETAEQFAAELLSRLSTCGEAGEALIDEINSGIHDYELLCRPAQRVLRYISGFRRRKLTYSQWKADGKRREK